MDKELAFVFPGQGSQSVGMMKNLADNFPIVRETFDEASNYLRYDLWHLVQMGPAEQLNLTEFTQPALLAAGVAAWRVWTSQINNPTPALVAGHSLGEYTALVCAGGLDYESGIRLVQKRGQLMQAAVPEGEGAMAVIIGIELRLLKLMCVSLGSERIIGLGNLNSPEQTVISGETSAVDELMAMAKENGAKLVKKLPVSVPSHSLMMQSASDKLGIYLDTLKWQTPVIPLINNVDVDIYMEPSKIKSALARQLYCSVRWVEVIEKMAASGIKTIIECGPGKVLSGLIKRIDTSLTARPIEEILTCHSV